MEPDFIEFIRNARKRKVEKFRTQLYIFLVCLVLSVFLWILVHLSKEYFYTTEYRLNYTQVPWNMKMTGCSDSVLILTIRLQGYEFFSEQFFRRRKRETDVSLKGLKMKTADEQFTGYLLTRGIARNIAEQTTYPLEIFATSPDTIFFSFEKRPLKRMLPARLTPVTLIHSKTDSLLKRPDSIHGNGYRSEINKKENPRKKNDK
ncbi:MAG: hypothetical protein NTW10_12975 [Bacteroidetes bacterium]|nr:hypothetical protein [Bacteroidota bacterium]